MGPALQLDSNTLNFSIDILSLLMAYISWTFPSPLAERDYGLKTWSVGITLGGLILIFLRGRVPAFWVVFVANLCLMVDGTLGLLALARFYQVRVRPVIVGAALVVGLGGLCLYTVWGASIAVAMVGVCLAMGVLLYSVLLVYRHGGRPVPLATHVFALSMDVMTVAYLLRAVGPPSTRMRRYPWRAATRPW